MRPVAERRDYYEILGVARDADIQAIKSAFRELALRYHPDRNRAPEAEERFKEIAEAYAVLGDPEKRRQYDAHGFAGVAGMRPEDVFAGIDLEDLFGGLGFDFGGLGGGGIGGSVFDRFFGARRRGPAKGANVEVDIEIPLEMVVKGGEHRVAVDHPRNCPGCSGSGAKPRTEPRTCEPCHGTGQQTHVRDEGNVHVRTLTPCPACRGRGRFIDEPCSACGGSGQVAARETLGVHVPVGVREGMALRVPGKGMPAPEGDGVPGDLYVVVRTRPDARFARRGPHLWREQELPIADAVLGTRIPVPTLDGQVQVDVPAGTQPDTVLRLRGRGLPDFRSEARGDLNIVVRLRVPADLAPEERALWEQLRRARSATG
jgi:molecular chaperone DnaJ